jgi:UPF0755 protein
MDSQPRNIRVPGPRQRRSAASRVFQSLFALTVLAALVVGGLGLYGFSEFTKQGPLAEPKVYIVEKGGAPEVAANLEKAGIISDSRIFALAALVTGQRNHLRAGEYEFPRHASIRDVLNLISSGKSIVYKLTIPEGWTTQMALGRVRTNDVLTGDLTLAPPEGALMADTYVFRRGKTRDALVQDMVASQHKLLNELWDKRSDNTPVTSMTEAVILASIVEKETARAEERPMIAAVFANRLKKGMRLQSDPTIIYGIAGGEGKLGRPLRKSDIAERTPYNTYQFSGLPPGPIGNPGRAAIEAVLHPADTKALYFVADGTGGHAFAETLEQHKANVAKWREIEKDQSGDVPGAVIDEEPEPQAAANANLPAASAPPAKLLEPQQQQQATLPAIPEPAPQTTGGTNLPPSKPEEIPADTAPVTGQQPAASDNALVPATVTLKPGSIISTAAGLIPLPMPKPSSRSN